jgi:hypothetical protein
MYTSKEEVKIGSGRGYEEHLKHQVIRPPFPKKFLDMSMSSVVTGGYVPPSGNACGVQV